MSRLSVLAFAAFLSAVSPLAAQGSRDVAVDPIGTIIPTGRFEGSPKVQLGRAAAGRTVCFVREQGDSHRLDIGVGAGGAFVRLATAEPRDATPLSPVRVYAGAQQVEQGRATDRFLVLKPHESSVIYVVPTPGLGSFTLVADGTPEAFLAVIAAAAGNFLVIEQRSAPVRDWVAIYDFDQQTAKSLAACRQRHGL